MIRRTSQEKEQQNLGPLDQNGDAGAESMPANVPMRIAPITIFAIPKPFEYEADRIQRNAINSWTHFRPDVEIVLLGDDLGTPEIAAELGVGHLSGVEVNSRGTPLLGSAFSLIQQFSQSPVLIYCNCDVILLNDFLDAIKTLIEEAELERFLAIGRRTDLEVSHLIDFNDQNEIQLFLSQLKGNGRKGPVVCKEFFAFTREIFKEVPDFAVGRGNWDNWMVANARTRGFPVVNISPVASAIHQTHGYRHAQTSRLGCYVTGPEARENQRLGGGKNLIRGASSTWELRKEGLKKKLFPSLNTDFWLDLPRFIRLLANLMAK